jgi:triosephosphate isomerase
MAAVLGKRAVVPSAARRVSSGAGVNRLVTRISEPFSSSRSVKCEVSKAKFFVGGNWKANGTVVSVNELVEDLNSRANDIPGGIDVCVSPSTIHIPSVIANLDANKYKVAAQNCSATGFGAHTGELAPEMLKDFGLKWVITGHSERRAAGETNEEVGLKTAKAVSLGLSVIACIGESLEQRESGSMYQVLDAQMQALLDNVQEWRKLVIAYEPIWAIGTGVVASPEQAQEVHQYLRFWCIKRLNKEQAANLRIIYGGSVNDGNADELAVKPDIDGFLVGGASLKAASFVRICQAVTAKNLSKKNTK